MPTPFEISKALADPASVFRAPADVVTASGLTRQQKLEILKQWELDARELEVAAEENMPGGEEARLDEVLEAIAHLAT